MTLSLFFTNFSFHLHYDFELDMQIDAPEEREAQTAVKQLEVIHKVAQMEMC